MEFELDRIFKANDIRGYYPEEINEDFCFSLGQAISQVFPIKNIVIARDTRNFSLSLSYALIAGFLKKGIDVFDIGCSTTPMFYYSVNVFKSDGGIIVTASHNPARYNGFKLVLRNAVPITYETGLNEIKKNIKKISISRALKSGKVLHKENIQDSYIAFLSNKLKDKLISKKVIIDCANGVSGIITKKLLDSLKIKHELLYSEPDGNFPNHDPDPLIEDNLKDLQNKISGGAIGLAFDGDGDRSVFVSEDSRILRGDIMTAFFSKSILKENKNRIIAYDVRSSKIVDETIRTYGGIPQKVRIGHSYIKSKMRKVNAIFAGELSSHFYHEDFFYCELGLLALIEVLNIIGDTKLSLAKLTEEFFKYFHTGELNFEIKNYKKVLNVLRKKYDKLRAYSIDGLTLEDKEWWFNIRPSNTEPLLRLNLEAKTEDLMKSKLEEVRNIIYQFQ